MKYYEVIIIGCGASGIMCALKSKQKNIAIIDSNTKPAKKILVTGNGRCNLTNINLTSKHYNVNIDKFLNKFDVNKTLSFFNSLGLETYSDDESRVYPISNCAKSVVDVLVNKLDKFINLILGKQVTSIKKENNLFIIEAEDELFSCKKLVIATGGNSKSILEQLKIDYCPFIPSLVALKSNSVKDLNGIKVSNVLVTCVNSLGQSKSEKGEVLFKEGGLSGIVIFNMSSLFSRINNFKGKILIDLLPQISEQSLIAKLNNRKILNVKLDKFFVGFFQNAIANEIFKQAKINTNINSLNLTDIQIKCLVKVIKNLSFSVDGCFDNNQIFSGGVALENLNENLCSKKDSNLFFAGEVCNVDGECGGYNLQWAWTSGSIVGESL